MFTLSAIVVFITLRFTKLSNASLSYMTIEDNRNVSTSFVDCLRTAGFSFKQVIMVSEEFEKSCLADKVMKSSEAPVTIRALGSKLHTAGAYVVFSQEKGFYEELLNGISSEDYIMLFILLKWTNKVEADKMLDSISSASWGHRTYRIFVLKEQKNSNVEVYCGKSSPPSLVDEWDSTKKQLTTNIFQLKNLISRIPPGKCFHRCLFKCIVIKHPPESIAIESEKGTLTLQGSAGRMLTSAMHLYNCSLSISLAEDVLEDYFRDEYGYAIPRSKFQPLSQILMTKQFDLAFGSFVYAIDSSPDIEFLLCYLNDNFGFFVPCGTEGTDPIWTNYYMELSVSNWACIAGLFFFLSLSLKLLARLLLEEKSVFTSVGRNMNILFGLHLENARIFRPSSHTMRLFLTLIMFYAMILSVAYKASLKSFLMAPLETKSIQSWEELERSDFKISGGLGVCTALSELCKEQPILKELLKRLKPSDVGTISEIIDSVTKKRDTAFFAPESVIVYVNSLPKDGDTRVWESICRVPGNVAFSPVTSFIMRKGSPFIEGLNRVIMYHLQGGLLKLFGSRDAHRSTSAPGLNSKQEAGTSNTGTSNTLGHLKGVFLLWFFGALIAGTAFVFEIFVFNICSFKYNCFKTKNC